VTAPSRSVVSLAVVVGAVALLAVACKTPSSAQPADPTSPDRDCLESLRNHRVSYVEEAPTRGVRTPIRVRGNLGTVRLVARDRREAGAGALMDCALAQALVEAAPIFAGVGVDELIYSGTYTYRTRRGSSKLSQHAHGLAVDVHAMTTSNGTVLDVRRDFERGAGTWAVTELHACVGAPVSDAGRRLRTLACRLRASSILREVITADDNSDHNDHFHLEAFPDAFTRARALLSPRIPVADD
jgi:hypothetical protein